MEGFLIILLVFIIAFVLPPLFSTFLSHGVPKIARKTLAVNRKMLETYDVTLSDGSKVPTPKNMYFELGHGFIPVNSNETSEEVCSELINSFNANIVSNNPGNSGNIGFIRFESSKSDQKYSYCGISKFKSEGDCVLYCWICVKPLKTQIEYWILGAEYRQDHLDAWKNFPTSHFSFKNNHSMTPEFLEIYGRYANIAQIADSLFKTISTFWGITCQEKISQPMHKGNSTNSVSSSDVQVVENRRRRD